MAVTVDFDVREVVRLAESLQSLSRAGAEVALVRALNHTGDRVRTRVRRKIAEVTGMASRSVSSSTKSYKARRGGPEYAIIGTGEHQGLVHFKAVQGRRGVSAAPWRKRRVFRGTFLATPAGDAKSMQVFRRTGEFAIATKGRYVGQRREKLDKLWGPSIPREMVRDAVPKAFNDEAAARLPGRIAHEVEFLLRKELPRTR